MSRTSSSLALALAGLALLAAAAWLWTERSRPPRSVLLIGLDTVRVDALGIYHGPHATATPHLDRLGREGVVFEQALAQAPVTGPSFASIHTGQYPVEHDVVHSTRPLPEARETLAEHLRARGFRTGGFVSCSILASRYGFDQGFEVYDEDFESPYAPEHFERDGAATTERALRWLEDQDGDAPFFAFVHFFDAHAPYQRREGSDLDPRWGRMPVLHQLERNRSKPQLEAALPGIRALYADEVAYVDTQVGRLLAALEAQGRLRDTLVVVVADHGEELFDHGFSHGHATSLSQSVLHVPLLLWHPPSLAPTRIATRVENVDVFPTVAALLGTPHALPAVSGRDLRPVIAGDPGAPRVVRAMREPYDHLPGGFAFAALDPRWKLVWFSQAPTQLYDLETDPAERANRAGAQPEIAARLQRDTAPWLDAVRALGFQDTQSLDPKDLEVLKALGYVE